MDDNRNLLRNRLLLYLSGAGADPVDSLEAAAECLRRIPPDADCADAMDMLDMIARERDLLPKPDERLRDLCLPPMVRTTLFACDLSSALSSARAFSWARDSIRKALRTAIPGSRT